MAASNKATALKDSYINSIATEVGPEGMAAAGAFQNDKLAGKLGMKAGGDIATVFADLDEGTVTGRNDGLPNVVITRAGEKVFKNDASAATPKGTQGRGAHEKIASPMQAAEFKHYNAAFDGTNNSTSKSQPSDMSAFPAQARLDNQLATSGVKAPTPASHPHLFEPSPDGRQAPSTGWMENDNPLEIERKRLANQDATEWSNSAIPGPKGSGSSGPSRREQIRGRLQRAGQQIQQQARQQQLINQLNRPRHITPNGIGGYTMY